MDMADDNAAGSTEGDVTAMEYGALANEGVVDEDKVNLKVVWIDSLINACDRVKYELMDDSGGRGVW